MDMKLRTKFSFLAIVLAVITISVAFFLLKNFSSISKVYAFQNHLQQVRFEFQNIQTFTDRVRSRGIDISNLRDEWVKIVEDLDEDFVDIAAQNDTVKISDEAHEMADNMVSAWSGMRSTMDSIAAHYANIQNIDISQMLRNTILQSGIQEGIRYYRDYENLVDLENEMNLLENELVSVDYVYENFSNIFNDISEEMEYDIDETRSSFFFWGIIVTIFAGLATCIVSFILVSQLIKKFQKIQVIASKLADRDLTYKAEVKGNDEVAGMVNKLNETIGILNDFFLVVKKTAESARESGEGINSSAAETASASHEINSNIDVLGRQFDMLGEAVTRTVESLEQMSTMLSILINDNLKQTSLLRDSKTAIDEIAQTIGNVSRQTTEKADAAHEIEELVSDGDLKMSAAGDLLAQVTGELDEIDEIIALINAIAEQTNILSMNAAIESSHAGEAGKGFSVVAEEIRLLAESTAENAQRISTSIYKIIENVHKAASTNSDAAMAFHRVSEQAKDMMNALQDINGSMMIVDTKSKIVTDQTAQVTLSANKINNYCDKLNVQQDLVSTEMDTMRHIFSEVISGISEIKQGTSDISERMMEVKHLSTESCSKMDELGASLNEFQTEEEEFEIPDFSELRNSYENTLEENKAESTESRQSSERPAVQETSVFSEKSNFNTFAAFGTKASENKNISTDEQTTEEIEELEEVAELEEIEDGSIEDIKKEDIKTTDIKEIII